MTQFYKAFLRHTHFSMEPIQIPLEGSDLLQMDAPILLRAKIPRQGDLLSDLSLRFQLPDIYSKIYLRPAYDVDLSGSIQPLIDLSGTFTVSTPTLTPLATSIQVESLAIVGPIRTAPNHTFVSGTVNIVGVASPVTVSGRITLTGNGTLNTTYSTINGLLDITGITTIPGTPIVIREGLLTCSTTTITPSANAISITGSEIPVSIGGYKLVPTNVGTRIYASSIVIQGPLSPQTYVTGSVDLSGVPTPVPVKGLLNITGNPYNGSYNLNGSLDLSGVTYVHNVSVQITGGALTVSSVPIEISSTAWPIQGSLGVQINNVDHVTLDRKHEFAWVRMIGARLIDTVTFTIGGQKIQEFTSDWIAARASLDYDNTTFQKWRYMIGDVPECFDPAQGVYAAPGNLYPHTQSVFGSFLNPRPVQNNSPSIPGRYVRVPLGLWFSDYISNSLPLVALQYHECEIQIKIRPLRDLYTVIDPSGVRLRAGIRSLPYIPTDQYPTTWNPDLLGPLPESLNNLYGSYTDLSGSLRHFLTDLSGAIPRADSWSLNATLEALYGFVTPEEQKLFTTRTVRYNVRQVQNFIFGGVTGRNTYRLDVHNIATRLVYFMRRSDAVQYRNQQTNLTNWLYPQGQRRPIAFPNGPLTNGAIVKNTNGGYASEYRDLSGNVFSIGASGMNIGGIRREIVRNVLLTANGQPLFDSIDGGFFNTYVPFRFLKGNGSAFADYGLATQSELWPIYTYSFATNGSSVEQPSGTLNTSRIDRLELDIEVEPIPFLANYTYELQTFVETLNFLEISNGLGGLKFAK